jgi:exonuclease SbcD
VKLLHTSDWHLGRRLHELDLLEHQRAVLQRVVAVAREEAVDAVLIAGDVYDRPTPPLAAVALLDEVLTELASFTRVVVSSGNHDQAVRLGFGSRLYGDRIHFRTSIERIAEPVELCDEAGPVLIYGIPYLDPDLARGGFGPDLLPRSHEAVLGAATAAIRADAAERGAVRTVVLAHAFVTGRRPSSSTDSELDLSVGGVQDAPAALFAGFTYTALGHLHRPQEPGSDGPGIVRYSGSPLRYSFSEAGQTKSVTLVELDAEGVKSVAPVELPQPRPMVELRGTLSELLHDRVHDEHVRSWVKATVIDPVRPEGMHRALAARFPHVLVRIHEPAGAVPVGTGRHPAAPTGTYDLVARFLQEATGEPPQGAELALLRDAIEALARPEDGTGPSVAGRTGGGGDR